ncbi:MAG: hypothetical protein JSV00_03220 [bacterium]|nr:MAG: hypothetical protein JSV00_03220 [bacterium]
MNHPSDRAILPETGLERDPVLKGPVARTGLAASFLLLAVLAGCLLRQSVTYQKESIRAYGEQEPFGEVRFHRLEAGSPARPYDGQPAFRIRLAGGEEFRSDLLEVETLRGLSGRRTIHPMFRVSQGWPAGAEEIDLQGCSFVVLGQRVLLVEIGSLTVTGESVDPPPSIGNEAGTRFYPFPLTLPQMESLFGKPVRLVKDVAK